MRLPVLLLLALLLYGCRPSTYEVRGRVRGLVASDDEVRTAMRLAFDHLHLVLEPGGAIALAAALHGRVPAGDGAIVAIASGANVDRAQFADILRGA